jgi:hypothetical protein
MDQNTTLLPPVGGIAKDESSNRVGRVVRYLPAEPESPPLAVLANAAGEWAAPVDALLDLTGWA